MLNTECFLTSKKHLSEDDKTVTRWIRLPNEKCKRILRDEFNKDSDWWEEEREHWENECNTKFSKWRTVYNHWNSSINFSTKEEIVEELTKEGKSEEEFNDRIDLYDFLIHISESVFFPVKSNIH